MFSWISTVIFTTVLLVFTLFNRQVVEVNLWPLGSWEMPLFLVALACGALGFGVGALIVWVRAITSRRQLRKTSRQLEKTSKEMRDLKIKLDTLLSSTHFLESRDSDGS